VKHRRLKSYQTIWEVIVQGVSKNGAHLRLIGIGLLAIAVTTFAGFSPLVAPASAQQGGVTVALSPTTGSTVQGSASITAAGEGTTVAADLRGLPGGSGATITLHAGSCALPSASSLRILVLTADATGHAVASGPIQLGSGSMPLASFTDGEHLLQVAVAGKILACGQISAQAGSSIEAILLAAGEQAQVMQFNPGASLQRRIFGDGFVPNSGEFRSTIDATTFAVQRAEHMGTGAVRVYFAREGDWSNVRWYQRGSAYEQPGQALLQEAERRQVIQFNPGAALQKRIFAEGYVPNSGEFSVTAAGTNFTAQRAEHLGTGSVRVYFAVAGNWSNVQFVQRGAGQISPAASVFISPLSGPTNTSVHLVGSHLPQNSTVSLWGGPQGSAATLLSTGTSDALGQFITDVRVVGAAGLRWVFGVTSGGGIHAESPVFTVTP
jgi:hypothetical protein